MSLDFELLAKQSMRGGEQRYTEADIRDMVGAPSKEEEEYCLCGKKLSDNSLECYSHMTQGY